MFNLRKGVFKLHSKLSNDPLMDTILALKVSYTIFHAKNKNSVSSLASSLICTVVKMHFLLLMLNTAGWIFMAVTFFLTVEYIFFLKQLRLAFTLLNPRLSTTETKH